MIASLVARLGRMRPVKIAQGSLYEGCDTPPPPPPPHPPPNKKMEQNRCTKPKTPNPKPTPLTKRDAKLAKMPSSVTLSADEMLLLHRKSLQDIQQVKGIPGNKKWDQGVGIPDAEDEGLNSQRACLSLSELSATDG